MTAPATLRASSKAAKRMQTKTQTPIQAMIKTRHRLTRILMIRRIEFASL
jgi:hypothetical protein